MCVYVCVAVKEKSVRRQTVEHTTEKKIKHKIFPSLPFGANWCMYTFIGLGWHWLKWSR